MLEQQNDIEVITPVGRVVKIGKREITITPLRVGQFARMQKLIGGISATSIQAAASGDIDAVMGLIDGDAEAVIDAVALATGLTKEQVAEAEMDEFVTVVADVIMVNADFFIRRLLPAMQAAVERAKTLGVGRTQSTPSSAAATDSRKS